MKNIIITIISIFFTFNTFAQGNAVRVIAKGNCSQLVDDIYTVDIFVKALNANETVTIAEQNYRFDFSSAALANPTIVTTSEGLGYNNPVISANGNISIFSQPTLTGSLANVVSFNIEMAGGDGLPLTKDTETYVGSIAFDVINPDLPLDFNWHHFIGSEENWPPTGIVLLNTTDKATGVFNDDMDLANEVTRTGMVVCTENDGSLRLDWPDEEYYYDLYVSMDGGQTFVNNPGEDEFTVYDLPVGDYDIRVKIGEDGCLTILDDINIKDFSHEVTRTWGHPTCGESDGWIELTWVKKVLSKIDISIDGGQSYTTVQAANEVYRIENLLKGNYDVRVKWSYAPYACPTQLDDVNLGVKTSNKDNLEINYVCKTNTNNCDRTELQLFQEDIGADRYQFRYRTFSNGWAPKWLNSTHRTSPSNTISNLPNITKVKVLGRVYCDGKWSAWSQQRHFNISPSKLANDMDNELINVYPNPANQLVTIDINGQEFETGTIQIYNLAGKEVQTTDLLANQNTVKLNVADMDNGVYLVKVVTNGNAVNTQKLTIAH